MTDVGMSPAAELWLFVYKGIEPTLPPRIITSPLMPILYPRPWFEFAELLFFFPSDNDLRPMNFCPCFNFSLKQLHMTKENNIDLDSSDPASRSAEATARPREASSAEEARICNQMRKLGTLPSKRTMQ